MANAVADIKELRAVKSGSLKPRETCIVKAIPASYIWYSKSAMAPDGHEVVRPSDIPEDDPGRWHKYVSYEDADQSSFVDTPRDVLQNCVARQDMPDVVIAKGTQAKMKQGAICEVFVPRKGPSGQVKYQKLGYRPDIFAKFWSV